MIFDPNPSGLDVQALIVDSGPVVLQATTAPYETTEEVDDGRNCAGAGEQAA